MGFNANPTIYRLEFDNPTFEGLFVRVRRGSVQLRSDYDGAATWREQLEVFQRVLVEWNLEDDDGTPLPLTVESLLATEDIVVKAILDAWGMAGRPAAPLGRPSTDGATESEPPQEPTEVDLELEGSIPMASLAS